MKTAEDKKYYVYFVKHRDIIVYIGSGHGARYEHASSGTSHNTLLNEIYFRNTILGDEGVIINLAEYNLTKEKALQREGVYIRRYRPVGNVVGNKGNKTFPIGFIDSLQVAADEMGLSVKVDGLRLLSDTRLLLTHLGCPFENENYRFDLTPSVYEEVKGASPRRIRLKDCVYECLLKSNEDFAMYRTLAFRGRSIPLMNGYDDRAEYYYSSSKQAAILNILHKLDLQPIHSKFVMKGRDGQPVLRCLTINEDDSYSLFDATEFLVVCLGTFADFFAAHVEMSKNHNKTIPKKHLTNTLFVKDSA